MRSPAVHRAASSASAAQATHKPTVAAIAAVELPPAQDDSPLDFSTVAAATDSEARVTRWVGRRVKIKMKSGKAHTGVLRRVYGGKMTLKQPKGKSLYIDVLKVASVKRID